MNRPKKPVPKSNQLVTSRLRSSRGFALVVALALMGFILLLLVGLAALSEVENRRVQGELDMLAARANAMYGLKVALAELQKAAGPDQRVTARADILTPDVDNLAEGTRYWTGVWEVETIVDSTDVAPDPVWLVSGAEGLSPEEGHSPLVEQVELVGVGSATESVRAAIVDFVPEGGGVADRRFAWWIGDEGVKAKVNLVVPVSVDDVDADDGGVGNLSLLTTARRYGIENVSDLGAFAALVIGEDADPDVLARMANYRQMQMLHEDIAVHTRDRFFDLTTDSFGVIANTRDGGLRRDLTARMAGDDDLDYPMWEGEFEGRTAVGPNWSLVREFSRLVESTANPESDGGGFPILPVQMSRVMGVPSYKSQQIYPQQPGLSPLLVYGGITYAITAREIDSEVEGMRSFRLRLAMKPVVALWNPYDVAIESDEGYVLYFNSRNGGMHQFGPRINIQNSSTDTYGFDRHGNVVFRTRNVPVAALMPGAPIPTRPQRTIWSDSSGDYDLRYFNPRFTIQPTTLLPGEVAWFSLPSGTSSEFSFPPPQSGDSLYGVEARFARAGPTLVRGHNPGAYVWVDFHDGPIGSTGYSDWEGTYADLGRVDFWEKEDDEGNEIVYSQQVQLEDLDSSAFEYDEDGNPIIDNPNEIPPPRPEGESYGRYPVRLRLAQSSGGQFGAEFMKGRVMLWGGAASNRSAGYSNKMLQYFWSPHEAVTALQEDFYDVEDFEDMFVGRPPIHFSTWAIVMSTPGWDNPRQLLAHFNPRATVQHNFRANNFGMGTLNRHDEIAPTTHGPIYHTEADGGLGVSAIFEINRIFPQEALRTVSWEEGGQTQQRTIGPVLFHVPRNELVSIGQLSHLELARNCFAPTYVVGNSYASPWLPEDQVFFTVSENADGSGFNVAFPDPSYHTNDALWDSYFFSTWNEDDDDPLNPRLKVFNPAARRDGVADVELFAASNMLIDGPFNINSTSVEAWKAVLSSLNQANLPFQEVVATGSELTESPLDSPFPRSSHLSMFGGLRTNGQLEFESWRGIPELTDEQIDAIATRIVYELRTRGRPFGSLATFVNREPDRDDVPGSTARNPRMMGILQRVLDADYGSIPGSGGTADNEDRMDGELLDPMVINPRGTTSDRILDADVPYLAHNPAAFTGLRSTGVPGYLMQADILQALAPILSPRSDTFVIRAYGDTLNPYAAEGSAEPRARAWCEAVVQRIPDYVGHELDPGADPADNELATHFGRQFRLISFRWLSPDEI